MENALISDHTDDKGSLYFSQSHFKATLAFGSFCIKSALEFVTVYFGKKI